MKTQIITGTCSITAKTADLVQQRFVGYDGAKCAAGAAALGICDADTAVGAQAPLNFSGILLVEAGGVIAADVDVDSDADGRAVTHAAGVVNGHTLDAATAAGEIIRVRR
ncbi:DUF2190 family protein [Geobacter pelophilus]|uniref:DUF2190 family protein n=1 Tax=Geoanaerobacter pelophilus TaxID=60036 RepID=A0AAW4L435_9BACT|nr:DUF2190 family protein [Geoanaerobacter pelophilus]